MIYDLFLTDNYDKINFIISPKIKQKYFYKYTIYHF